MAVALYNQSLGTANPTIASKSVFSTISQEQYTAIIIEFLACRLALLSNQISELLQDEDLVLPGSARMAMSLARQGKETSSAGTSTSTATNFPQTTILFVSMPAATGTKVARQ